MSSKLQGKSEVTRWIRENVAKDSLCLDVGACDGVWSDLLRDHLRMVGVEIFEPNIVEHNLESKYKVIFNADIREFEYEHFDLIIFGDVIEHMSVADAQSVLKYAYDRADQIVVAVPFRYHQGAIYGNPYERHIQDDLTHELFMSRYQGFEPFKIYDDYGYYIKSCH